MPPGTDAGDLVFPVRRGSTYQRYNVFVRRGFHKLMEEAGLVTEEVRNKRKILVKHYTPYSLRHFFASMLIEKNTNLKYVQTVMGHESIKMTFDVYGHIIRRKETDDLIKSAAYFSTFPSFLVANLWRALHKSAI